MQSECLFVIAVLLLQLWFWRRPVSPVGITQMLPKAPTYFVIKTKLVTILSFKRSVCHNYDWHLLTKRNRLLCSGVYSVQSMLSGRACLWLVSTFLPFLDICSISAVQLYKYTPHVGYLMRRRGRTSPSLPIFIVNAQASQNVCQYCVCHTEKLF